MSALCGWADVGLDMEEAMAQAQPIYKVGAALQLDTRNIFPVIYSLMPRLLTITIITVVTLLSYFVTQKLCA